MQIKVSIVDGMAEVQDRERQAGITLQRMNRSIDRQNPFDTKQADAGAAAPLQVVTATRNLKYQPFIPGGDPIVKGKAMKKKDALIIYNIT